MTQRIPETPGGQAGAHGHASGRSLRILAVDDDPSEFPLLERGFEQAGLPVLLSTATTAQIALVTVHLATPEERPHLALVDIGMPLINGFALARQFRQDGLPTLMISTLVDDVRRQRATELGALGLLAKPKDVPGYRTFAHEVMRMAGHLAK